VCRIAAAEGVDPDPARSAQTAAATDFTQAKQRALMNRLAAKVDSMIDGATTHQAIRDLCVAGAIVVDKRRLMDGEATERAESNAVAELSRRLAVVTERRGAG
jgi:hypothetical protein